MGARGLVIPRKSHLRFRWDDVGAAELRRFAQGEADRCAALWALAIAQALEGASRAEAARLVGRERQSLRDAVVRYVEPRGVERVLMAHSAVRDAVVVGVPDPVLGQRVAALVQLADDAGSGAVLESVRATASTQLADYKVPERLLAVGAIPRNAAGKIDRQAVLAMMPSSEAGAFTTAPNHAHRRDPNVS